jgi:hypothetical protein
MKNISKAVLKRIRRARPEEVHAIRHYGPLKHIPPFGEIRRDEKDHLKKIDRFLKERHLK